jgi:hypothetical protein
MTLPKLSHPQITIVIPSTNKPIRFRPFLVKEEKILLMAKTSEDESDILIAIKQVVNNCLVDGQDFDINTLSLFDLEYVFIQLRAYSVNDTVQVSYKDNEDEKIYDFDITLKDVKVIFPGTVDKIIKIDENAGIVMKYPTSSLYEDKEFLSSGSDSFFQLIARCMDKIYDGEEVFDCSSYKKKDLEEYLENLDIKTFEKIRDFMVSQPRLSYTIKYKNAMGNEREIELTTLADFFTLR